MTTWTDAQYQAIHRKDKNITVSASAGSGKTTILVERILTRTLVDKVPLDKILAMTFTEAAASEMKKRLFKSLMEAKSQATLAQDNELLSYLNEQLVLLQRTQITTIHSFCLSILQENYALIGFGLRRLQNIISDDFALPLKQQAMRDTIAAWMDDASFPALKQYFSPKPHDQSVLEEQVMLVARSLADMTNQQAYLELVEEIHTAKRMADLPNPVRNGVFSYLQDYCFYIQETLQQMELTYSGEKESNIGQKLLFLEQLIAACEAQDYALFHLHFPSYAAITTATCMESKQYTTMRKQLHDLDGVLASVLFEESLLLSDLRAMYPLIELLLNMALTYREAYVHQKELAEVMDFEDMESKALAILKVNDYEVAKRYKTRFIDILVDEYQDSSYHQDELIQLIQNKNNVFRVGDVKQSIYRFRGAVPDLLKGYILSPQELDEVIHLRHNYRSNSQIIHFVNGLFDRLMNLPSYPKLFAQEDVAQVGMSSQQTSRPSIALHVLITDMLGLGKEETDQGVEDVEGDEDDGVGAEELRATYIANLIIEDKERMNKKWSDYVILVRSHNRKNSLKKAFETANIPNFIDSREGFYNATVIEVMRAFFKVIEDPDDNLYFTALCMSSLYGMSDNALAQLKLQAKQHSFYAYACRSDNRALKQIVGDIHRLQTHIRLTSLLSDIYQINDFYDAKTTSNDRNNLDLLYEKAILFEEDGQKSLSSFIQFTDALVDSKSSEALSINTAEDVVRVMTIHQSKGLQFDTVIYWGKEQASRQNSPLLYIDENYGFGMDYVKLPMRLRRPSITKTWMEHRNTKEEIGEEIRILYVALTRAKQQLFMITSSKADQMESLLQFPLTTYQLQRSMRFGHWLANLSSRLPDALVSTTLINQRFQPLIVAKKVVARHTIPRWQTTAQVPVQVTPSQLDHDQLFDWVRGQNHASIGLTTHRLIQAMDVRIMYRLKELRELAMSIDSSLADQIDYQKILILQQSDLYQLSIKNEVRKEVAFTFLNELGQVVSGYIDFVSIDDHSKSIIIIDFKTDQHTTEIELGRRYHKQLHTYRQAMESLYPRYKVRCFIYSLWLSGSIEV